MAEKKTKIITKECLLNNYLEKDIQAYLLPLDLHIFMFQSKFRIRDNFITPNTHIYSTIAFFIIFIITFMSLCECGIFFNLSSEEYNVYLDAGHYFYVTTCVGSLYFTNVSNCMLSIDLVLKIQYARRALLVKRDLKSIIIFNWVSLMCLIVNYMFTEYILYSAGMTYAITDLMSSMFNFIMLYASRMMKLLRTTLDSWIEEMQNNKMLLNLELEESETICDWDKMLIIYNNLADAFFAFKRIFSVPVIATIFYNFYEALALSEQFVALYGSDLTVLLNEGGMWRNLIFTWTAKNVWLLWHLCQECEKFYTSLNIVEVKCTAALGLRETTVAQRRLYKNILRLNRVMFTKFSAGSLFTVDAHLPVNFIHQFTTYIIVQLQFVYVQNS